eukprot:447558-Pelagomonas_calceolata.AAC.5
MVTFPAGCHLKPEILWLSGQVWRKVLGHRYQRWPLQSMYRCKEPVQPMQEACLTMPTLPHTKKSLGSQAYKVAASGFDV